MGKKRFNWKAREVVNTLIDNSSAKQIKLDLENYKETYDSSNQLVLPSEKRRTKVKHNNTQVVKLLSKKQRKNLEKVVERKKKKQNRENLLESIKSVQISAEELAQLTSIASVQTEGLKKYFNKQAINETVINRTDENGAVPNEINSVKGAYRKRHLKQSETYSYDKVERRGGKKARVIKVSSSDSSMDTDDDDNDRNEDKQVKNDKKDEVIKIEEESVEPKENEIVYSNKPIEIIKIKDSDINMKKEVPRKPAVYVNVDRNEEIQAARLKLPILAEEQQIMETINENSVIIIAGETGSGKTTQIPQFLYEGGYALDKQIGITEPRRVAATSMSQRVAEEMNLSPNIISYLIRFEGNVTDETRIKFMTDGVLLKEMQTDFLLKKYSVIILDEAHERSAYTDILIGLLSRAVPLRNKRGDPLKLIIMSATLQISDFTENNQLFRQPPPVINIDSRQFPVTVHFNRNTNENYLKDAFRKTIKIHNEYPNGGILIFVTGQKEVKYLIKKLQQTFPLKSKQLINKTNSDATTKNHDISAIPRKSRRSKRKIIPEINLDDYSLPNDNETNSDLENENDNVSDDEDIDDVTVYQNAEPLWVLPLYSLLPSWEQQKVFKAPPPNCRLCVVSTNVAETSLTIPNIKYVIDSGKTKYKLYDKVTGLTSYAVDWTSKASANQRAGRAGRVAPGHCFRLYSSAMFNDVFPEFSTPEILKKPVDDIYLQLKCMLINKVEKFPFVTSPDSIQLKAAEKRLEILGVLQDNKVTELGRAVSKFPVLPRFGKMLSLSHQHNMLPYTICLVAALSVQEVLLETPIGVRSPEEQKEIRQKWTSVRQQWAGTGNSLLLGDNCILLKAVGGAEFANFNGKLETFCEKYGLRHKAIIEIRKLRIQLTNEIKRNFPGIDVVVDPKMKPPTDIQMKLLRQLLLAGMGDKIAKKVNLAEVKDQKDKHKFKYAYHTNNMEEPVFLHQSSVLKKILPELVIYQEIYETNKIYMRGVTAIEAEWIPIYVPMYQFPSIVQQSLK